MGKTMLCPGVAANYPGRETNLIGGSSMVTVSHLAQESNPHYIIIPLTKDKFAMVDIADADLALNRWHISSRYAARRTDNQVLMMHRIILERKLNRPILEDMLCDHINGNELDNRRANLREVTKAQNAWNSKTQKNNVTQYTGVSYRQGYYIARLGSSGTLLGVFETALDASFCYDKEALNRWGEFARLNHSIEEIHAWKAPPRHLNSTNTSGYWGVTKVKGRNKWQASYRHKGNLLYLGRYNTPEDAAKAYDLKVIELNGEKAALNFPREDYKPHE